MRTVGKAPMMLMMLMLNALPFNLRRLRVVEGAMDDYNHRSEMQHERNDGNDRRNLYEEEMLELQLAKETKRNNEDCPDGFEYVASLNRCYSLLSDALHTRQEASIECRKRHQVAHLPVIENEQQHNAIVDILQKSDHGGTCPVGVWTSGRRSHPFRSFSWQPDAAAAAASNGTSSSARTHDESSSSAVVVLTYTNWAKNRPWFAYGLNRNCLYVDRSKAWQWNQRSCEAKLCVICQIDLF